MESRQFIKAAAALTQRIKDNELVAGVSGNQNREEDNAIQKELNAAFQGLQNPTLPSAYKLRDVALDYGFMVDQRVQGRLQQGESLWGN